MDIEDFVNGVVENARKNIPRNPEDYVQDGLLYCGKCHTPKQGRYECAGKTYEPFDFYATNIHADNNSMWFDKEGNIIKLKTVRGELVEF